MSCVFVAGTVWCRRETSVWGGPKNTRFAGSDGCHWLPCKYSFDIVTSLHWRNCSEAGYSSSPLASNRWGQTDSFSLKRGLVTAEHNTVSVQSSLWCYQSTTSSLSYAVWRNWLLLYLLPKHSSARKAREAEAKRRRSHNHTRVIPKVFGLDILDNNIFHNLEES